MATKKDIETVAETVENAVENAAEEVKKAVKKAAPKAAETVEKVGAAAKNVAAEAAETLEKVEKAAKNVAAEAAETLEEVEKAAKKAAGQATEAAADAVAKVAKKAGKAAEQVGQKAEAVKGAAKEAAKGEKKDASKAGKKGKDTGEAKAFTEGPRLKKRYAEEIAPAMRAKFGYVNAMQVPRLEKIILNMGLGAEKDNPKGIETAAREIGLITGQKAVVTRAKKSVANFKVREGMNVGAKVTLRGDRMYYFIDKLMNIVLPRVRDFRGVSDKAFDGRGNYALGLKEQLIFPEINYDDVDKVRGMNIVFVTSAETDEECKELLTLLGMPFVQG